MKNITKAIIIALIAVVSTSFCEKNEVVDIEKMENEVLKYVNEYRVKNGKDPLVMNEYLREESRLHSKNMANGTAGFGHGGFNDRTDRIWDKIGTGAISENVAYNYSGAKEATEQWINSSGHRENMLGNYTITGIGIAKSGKKYYFTQIFLYSK